MRSGIVLLLAVAAGAAPARAQDTLRLGALQEAAVRGDPRAGQYALFEEAAGLRLADIAAERLPQLALDGQAAWQSDVTSIPVRLPGAEVREPPKDRYQVRLTAEERLYDGGEVTGRRAVERARLAERQAELHTRLYALRAEVNEAFFSAYLFQQRRAETAALITDLEARLALLRARFAAGAALPGDTAAVAARLLEARQAETELSASRRASLAVLGDLTHMEIGDADVLVLPELAVEAQRVRAAGGAEAVRERPEFTRFVRTRERLGREAELVAAQRRPHVSAFGELGYGRPGLDQFSRSWETFWRAGVRVRWQPWQWGSIDRRQEALAIQREIVATEEAAFADRVERGVRSELEAMERLRAALAVDDRIVALREQVERQARARFEEGVVTAAEYVERRTDVLEARLARERHRVELARARARYLTTLGIEIEP